jgi:hypothetical protein
MQQNINLIVLGLFLRETIAFAFVSVSPQCQHTLKLRGFRSEGSVSNIQVKMLTKMLVFGLLMQIE